MHCDRTHLIKSPLFAISISLLFASSLFGQPLGEPDRSAPGDRAIQEYLTREALRIESTFSDDFKSLQDWEAKRDSYYQQYMFMLGLHPLPEKTELHATKTGEYVGEGFVVEMLHYQSRPGLYVTGNLYRPSTSKPGQKHPAIFYVCGHSGRERNGNKTAFQSHGIWFARHGYVCLIVDTLQLGEIAAFHHGTYNLNRWWWHSRGYTPAGVEAWNGVRGIDYLVSRDDVDAERIAVTGISGGGAATFWIAAADPRVQVAIPVSGMADLQSYVPNRVSNGHCDCMFMYNAYEWPWTRIGSLIAPRPLLFANSDQDPIFPMDANERVINRLERVYSLYGATDRVDAIVSVGGHAYRKDIREAEYRFLNSHFFRDASPIVDSEVDVVTEGRYDGPYPIPLEKLRVFPTDADLPKDQRNTTIDEVFVPMATVPLPETGKFEPWKEQLVTRLNDVTFRNFDKIAAAKEVKAPESVETDSKTEWLSVETPLLCKLQKLAGPDLDQTKTILLIVSNGSEKAVSKDWFVMNALQHQSVYLLETRGIGVSAWTAKNPPNYILRSHVLLGKTVDSGRAIDTIGVAKYLKSKAKKDCKLTVAGTGRFSLIAATAGLYCDEVDGVIAHSPATSFMSENAPQFLNVLRVCDSSDLLGMLAPKKLVLQSDDKELVKRVQTLFETARSPHHFESELLGN